MKKIKSRTLMLPDQGHILNIGYNIDEIYSDFFELLNE